ncbi:MAG: uncharacterized protein A8A55_1289 [Amphiamblys sp. WSBS2006]|nr:MAG: uncharacterized protein A8A55_1289 [Amphiamblys sp. WSBS2006]
MLLFFLLACGYGGVLPESEDIGAIVNGNIRCGFPPFAGIDVECPGTCFHTYTRVATVDVTVTDIIVVRTTSSMKYTATIDETVEVDSTSETVLTRFFVDIETELSVATNYILGMDTTVTKLMYVMGSTVTVCNETFTDTSATLTLLGTQTEFEGETVYHTELCPSATKTVTVTETMKKN